MYPSIRNKNLLNVLLVLCFVLSLTVFSPSSHAQGNRELIVVIDVSTSMHDIFDQAKIEAKQFISGAQLGERVTIITFGKTADLQERSRIRSSYDITRLLSVIDELQASEYASNLPQAMERGLQEMSHFYEENPDRERVLMWLSDDKNNPPDDIPNLITFSSLKREKLETIPDQSWFDFEAPIEGELDSDVQWFVDWASRAAMRLEVELLADAVAPLTPPELEAEIRILFKPGTPAIQETSFSVVAEIISGSGQSYPRAIPATPPKVVCKGSDWEEAIRIMLPNQPGAYKCRISFVLPSDKLLNISPPQINVPITVKKPKIVPDKKTVSEPKVTIAKDKSQKRPKKERKTDKAFASEERAELAKAPMAPLMKRPTLTFSQIVPGGRYHASTSLTPSRDIPPDSLSMKSDFDLPPGLVLQPEFRMSDEGLVADLSLSVAENAKLNEGWDMKGTVSFLTSEENVKIDPTRIAMRFQGKKGLSQWGRRELQQEPTYAQFGKVWAIIKSYMAMGIKAALIIAVMLMLFYLVRKFAFGASELVGSFEIVRNPTNRKMNSINLRRLGKFRRANSLTVGSGNKADIVLPHSSVAELHAKITTAKTAAGPVVFVQTLLHNQILVNDIAYSHRKEIADRDILEIGEFILLYRCPEVQKETIIQFADGKSMRGILISWDIDANGFEFLPSGAPSLDAKMNIDFSEIKAVLFIRKPERFSLSRLFGARKKPSGRPIEVIFNDGDLLEGVMVGEASEWSNRFYLIPNDHEEVALALVERAAVQNVFMRDTLDAAGA